MEQKTAAIVGATGLIGHHLLQKLIESDQYKKIYVISRRITGVISEKVTELNIELNQIDALKVDDTIDHAFCCLGTTMKKAGSKDAFYQVDYTYVVGFAEWAKGHGAKLFSMVTAMGADRSSMFYYNRVKGDVEAKINNIDFESIQIFRPSLLLGGRDETRIGEGLGKIFFALFGFLMPKRLRGIKGEKVAAAMIKAAIQKPKESKVYLSHQISSYLSE